MFTGDWLLYGRVEHGKLEFEGLFDPWDAGDSRPPRRS